MNSDIILKAGGIIIKDKKFALERHGGKDVYILPGGKLEHGESFEQALIRELMEEFGIEVLIKDIEKIGDFESRAVHIPDKRVKVIAFIVKKWKNEIVLDDGLEEILWVNTLNINEFKVSPIVKEIFPLLVSRGLID